MTDGKWVTPCGATKREWIIWAYGVTTVPQRFGGLLPATLTSLRQAGFPSPWLFVDGTRDSVTPLERFAPLTGLTVRHPAIRPFGNWILALAELYIRFPTATRFAMFQDDFVTYQNLREYLERCYFQPMTYWNLYTFPQNQQRAPKEGTGWFPSNQAGRGAVALVFDRPGVIEMLSSKHMADRPQDPGRGWRAIDGGVVESLKKVGYKELCHNPSLVQHTGIVTSIPGNPPHKLAISFRGEDFDALSLL